MAFSEEQRGVIGGIAAGLATTIGALGAALALPPMQVVALGAVHSRLNLWTEWAVIALLPLVISVAMLAQHRFASADDIHGSGLAPGTERARVLQAVLQNTLEQTVIWAGVSLIWALRMPTHTLGIVPVSAFLFLMGRLLFAARYKDGAPGRALGFALTFYPSVAMAVLLVLERLGVSFDWPV